MKFALLLGISLAVLSFGNEAQASRNTSDFNDEWYFKLGSQDRVPQSPDSSWKPVTLPHDWAVSGSFDPESDGTCWEEPHCRQGRLPWKGEGWYLKLFSLPQDVPQNRRVILVFDGVMSNPQVYVNGEKVGSWRYGYNSFWVDATDAVRKGTQENSLAVHASTLEHSSRWYPGAGIYRKVRLHIVDPLHVPIWGVWVRTAEISEDRAVVSVSTDIRNDADVSKTATLRTQVVSAGTQRVIAEKLQKIELDGGEAFTAESELELQNPKLWDVAKPNLYHAITSIEMDGREIDSVTTRFGVRSVEWSADEGLLLNGMRVQLKGVNLHHDNGPLGAVALHDALFRKLSLMRDMGVNAIRTSHNPPSPELLDLADEMGLLVIDELFDRYGPTASVDASNEEYVQQYAEAEVRNFIRRDRNHPSVILWSIGNEVSDVLNNRDGMGRQHVTNLVKYFNKYDPTRLTNMASNWGGGVVRTDILDSVETLGWNYGRKYHVSRKYSPDKAQIYTESSSAFSTRGYYSFDHIPQKDDYSPTYQESSYDYSAARWGDIPDVEFLRMEQDSYVAGEFVWTGFDYLGEPTPHQEQARSSYFGIVDLVGIPKDRYFLYRSQWNDDSHTVHVLPHWTWPGHEGKSVPVYVYTSGDEAELFVNGKSYGKRRKTSADQYLASMRSLAYGKAAASSSESIVQTSREISVERYPAADAVDGDRDSYWQAADGTAEQWLQVDLGRATHVGYVSIDWLDPAIDRELRILHSDDGERWEAVDDSVVDRRSEHRTVAYPDERDAIYASGLLPVMWMPSRWVFERSGLRSKSRALTQSATRTTR